MKNLLVIYFFFVSIGLTYAGEKTYDFCDGFVII